MELTIIFPALLILLRSHVLVLVVMQDILIQVSMTIEAFTGRYCVIS